jgi:predicted nucleotidyltransferase
LREDDYFCERSDIDLAVEGLAPGKYFPMLVMIDRIVESPFEINVVTMETCDESLKQKILSEGELLYE